MRHTETQTPSYLHHHRVQDTLQRQRRPKTSSSNARRLPSCGSAPAPEVRSRNLERPSHFHRVRTIGRKQYWLSAALSGRRSWLSQMYTSCLRLSLAGLQPHLISSNLSFFRTGDALRMDVVEKKTPVSEIAIVCGAERGVFELKRFGPGGASRCIRSTSWSQ